jgi:CheY-like chemotaxis protein
MLADRATLVALVVEDEFLLRYDFVRELKARGWLVLEAASEEAAVELFGNAHVDVLFTDIRLGGRLSGWDVAETFRAKLPELAVAYTSANPPDQARQVADGLFFDKPYDPKQVVEACERLLA